MNDERDGAIFISKDKELFLPQLLLCSNQIFFRGEIEDLFVSLIDFITASVKQMKIVIMYLEADTAGSPNRHQVDLKAII